MTSNIKPKTPVKEAPTEPFKRAVGRLRARDRRQEATLRSRSPPSVPD